MGIRFCCQNGHKLHVKAFLAGKTGICPECGVKVQIPAAAGDLSPLGPPPGDSVIHSSVKSKEVESNVGGIEDVQWFVKTAAGDQFGPATREIFEDWVSEGRISNDCLVWREGWDQWQPVTSAFKEQSAPPPEPIRTFPPAQALKQEAHSDEFGKIEIDPVAPPRRNAKRRSLTLVYLLLAACLMLLFPLIYIVTVKT